jgi:hypothetical protein
VCGELGGELDLLLAQGVQAVLERGDAFAEPVGSELGALEGFVVAVERALGSQELAPKCALARFEFGSLVA